MDLKRILRTPVVWVVLVIGTGLLLLSVFTSSSFVRIDTSAAEKLVNDGAVDSAKFVGDDRIDLTLKKGRAYLEKEQDRSVIQLKVMAEAVADGPGCGG